MNSCGTIKRFGAPFPKRGRTLNSWHPAQNSSAVLTAIGVGIATTKISWEFVQWWCHRPGVDGVSNDCIRCGTSSCSLSARSAVSDLDSAIHSDRSRRCNRSFDCSGLDRGRSCGNAACSGCSPDLPQQLRGTAWLSRVGTLLPLLQFSFCDDADPQRAFHPDGPSSSLFQ